MEDILENIIPLLVIIAASIIQTVLGKKKKKVKKLEEDQEVLGSPFPQVDESYPVEFDMETPTSNPKEIKSIWDTISDLLGDNTPKSVDVEQLPVTENNERQSLVRESMLVDKPEVKKREKSNLNQIAKQNNNEGKTDDTYINFSDQEDVKRAFVASLIFDRKY